MSWSQAHGSARAVVSEAKIKFISLSLLADSDLSDSELPESHNFWADRKNFVGAYPPVPPPPPTHHIYIYVLIRWSPSYTFKLLTEACGTAELEVGC